MRPTARMRSLRWQLGGLACLVWLTGCGTVQSVPVKDNDSGSVAVRATIRPQFFGKGVAKGEREGPGIEIGYESYRAHDTQTLAAGQSIVLDGGVILGPDTLNHEAKLRQAYLAYNHLIRFGANFQLEPFVGATRVHLKMRSNAASGLTLNGVDDWRTGAIGGVTPRWRFNDWLAIEARLSYFNASAWAHGQSYEAAVVLNPLPNLAVRLGYSERRHDVEAAVFNWYSEVNVRARGPMASLQFDF